MALQHPWIVKKLQLNNFISYSHLELDFQWENPFLLIGQNKDDDGQGANGSGKSSLLDGIAFATSGTPLRSVVLHELVKFTAAEASTEIIFTNGVDDLVVKRTINKKSKSSTVEAKMYYNGSQKGVDFEDGVSASEINRLILEKLGVNKDLLFDYYIVSKARFKPFLLLSDNDKKALISSFIDVSVIDQSIVEVDTENKKRLTKIDNTKGKLTGYQEQIKRLEDVIKSKKDINIEEKVAEQVLGLNTAIQENENKIKEHHKAKSVLEESLKKLREKTIDSSIDTYLDQKESLRKELAGIEEEIAQIKADKKADIDTINDNLSTIEAKILSFKETILECQKAINAENGSLIIINNQLLSSITCPHCLETFIPEMDKDGIPKLEKEREEKNSNIQLLDEHVASHKIKIEKRQKTISEVNDVKKRVIAEYDLDLDLKSQTYKDVKNSIVECEKLINEFYQAIQANERQKSTIEVYIEEEDKTINKLRNEIKYLEIRRDETDFQIKVHNSEIETLDKQLIDLHKEADKITVIVQDLEIDYKNFQETLVQFKSFKNYMIDQGIWQIDRLVNDVLKKMQSNLSIKLVSTKELSSSSKTSEKINATVMKNGFPYGSYQQLSAGEKARIDLAFLLTFKNLFSLDQNDRFNLLILDEVLDSCDAKGIESMYQAIKYLNQGAIIVSQNQVPSLITNTIVATKYKGNTSITIGNF